MVRFEVAVEDSGLRLDQLLARRVPELSRRKARVLIDIGGVFVGGSRVKVASRKISAGQVVEANLGGALERATKEVGRAARDADDARLPPHRVVHVDDDLVVADKPAGLLAAPTPESDRGNLAALLEAELGPRVYVVHRIDLDTSGLLVYARTGAANRALSERFRTHDIERVYRAVLAGRVADDDLTVDAAIAGKHARTHLRVLARADHATLVEARLETGRTHQIRIHAAGLGHPVVGDVRYGEPAAHRMALHAMRLGFVHPRTGEGLSFDSPWPASLLPAWPART